MTCAGLAQLAVRAALAGEGPSPPVPAGGFTVARPGGIPPGTGSTRGVRKPERARIHDTPPHDPSGRHGPAPKARHDSPGARRPGRSCARGIPAKGENEPCPVSPRGQARIAPRTGPREPLRTSESTPDFSPVVAAPEGRRTSCSSCSTTWAAVRPRSSAARRSFRTRAGPSAAIRSSLAAASARPEGPQTLVMDFAHGGGMGRGSVATVRVGGAVHATGRVAITTPLRSSTRETLDFGSDTGTPVDRPHDGQSASSSTGASRRRPQPPRFTAQ